MPSLMDDILRDAMQKGEFDNLPGAGKPLKLNDDPHTPAELRMAYKVLKDNDMPPEWIAAGKDFDAARENLLKEVRAAVRRYRGSLNDAARSAQPEQTRLRVEASWKATLESLREAVKALNRTALNFNLKAPQGVAHKPMFDLERELQKLG
jgi:DnaJ family protein C protein 28